MKIGIYLDHGYGNGVGGAEMQMAYLASVWSRTHQVDIIHHRPQLTRERLSTFSSDNLDSVDFRYIGREDEPPSTGDPFRRYHAAKHWHAAASRGYDLFINSTPWLPCFCHAQSGLLLVLFPFYVRPCDSPDIQRLPKWKQLRHRAYYDFEWRRRLGTYKRRFTISRYSQAWTKRRYGIDCEVVHPPVDVDFPARQKEDLILSVGRFATLGNTKNQLEMMRIFAEVQNGPLRGWSYASVGGLNTRPDNHTYFRAVEDAGRGYPTIVRANLPRTEIRDLFARARIFWHAAGLGEDEQAHPERSEHFGIATVEAMAAGCVPVVINKGGQPEIVEHGRSGFVWNTTEELTRYTHLLARDRSLWANMSAAASARAAEFTRERFLERFSSLAGVPVRRSVTAA